MPEDGEIFNSDVTPLQALLQSLIEEHRDKEEPFTVEEFISEIESFGVISNATIRVTEKILNTLLENNQSGQT